MRVELHPFLTQAGADKNLGYLAVAQVFVRTRLHLSACISSTLPIAKPGNHSLSFLPQYTYLSSAQRKTSSSVKSLAG